jgi:hypothetical protein
MALSEEDKKEIESATESSLSSVSTAGVVSALSAGVKILMAMNFQDKNISGNKAMTPSEEEVAINKTEVGASETEGKLSKDGLAAQEGTVKASETEAKASTADATAAEAGAQAVRTKAGASDIEVKALKMT